MGSKGLRAGLLVPAKCAQNFLDLDARGGIGLQAQFSDACCSFIVSGRAANKLHRSSVGMIVVYMLPAPTYHLHVAQFYESVMR